MFLRIIEAESETWVVCRRLFYQNLANQLTKIIPVG